MQNQVTFVRLFWFINKCSCFIEFIKQVKEKDQFNNTGAEMTNSIYHMMFKLCCNHVFRV